jgi:hypothetical protein
MDLHEMKKTPEAEDLSSNASITINTVRLKEARN